MGRSRGRVSEIARWLFWILMRLGQVRIRRRYFNAALYGGRFPLDRAPGLEDKTVAPGAESVCAAAASSDFCAEASRKLGILPASMLEVYASALRREGSAGVSWIPAGGCRGAGSPR